MGRPVSTGWAGLVDTPRKLLVAVQRVANRLRSRTMRISWMSRTAGAVALVTVLSGCGASAAGSTTQASGKASPRSTAASSSPVPPPPPTAAALQAVVVQQSEMPSGWTGQPYQASPDDNAGNAGFLRCVGARDTRPDQASDQHSPDFSTADGATVSSSATSYHSQQDVTDDVSVLSNPKASDCFATQMRAMLSSSGLPAGAKMGTPKVVITPGSSGGPSNVKGTGTGTVTVTVSGTRMTFYLNVAFISGRLTESEVDFFGVGTPVPSALRSTLIAAVATRTAAL
jgi:hypothetical protein